MIIGDHSALFDMRGEMVLTVPIDESVRAHGVRIVLEHQFPPATGDRAAAIAYKLRSASYSFAWE